MSLQSAADESVGLADGVTQCTMTDKNVVVSDFTVPRRHHFCVKKQQNNVEDNVEDALDILK